MRGEKDQVDMLRRERTVRQNRQLIQWLVQNIQDIHPVQLSSRLLAMPELQ